MKLLVCTLLLLAVFTSCNQNATEVPCPPETNVSQSGSTVTTSTPAPEQTHTTTTVTRTYTRPQVAKTQEPSTTVVTASAPAVETSSSSSSNVVPEPQPAQPAAEADCAPESSSSSSSTEVSQPQTTTTETVTTYYVIPPKKTQPVVVQHAPETESTVVVVSNESNNVPPVVEAAPEQPKAEADCAPESSSSSSSTEVSQPQTTTTEIVTTYYVMPPKKTQPVVVQHAPETESTVVVVSNESNNVPPVVEAAPEQPKVEADCASGSSSSTETVSVVSSNNISPSVEAAPPAAETESASSSNSNSEATTTTTVTTTYIPLSSVAYTEVSISLIGSDSLVDKLLSFGAAHIIKVANQKYPLDNLNFTVTQVNHLYVKTIGDYIDYKFSVRLNNTDGYYIDTVFCVGYYNSTGKMEWISYKWNLNHYSPETQQTETTTTTETVIVTKVENAANVVETPKVLPEVVEQPAHEAETVVVVEQVSHPAPEAEVVSEQPKPEADCETSSSTETVQVISSSNVSPSIEVAQPAAETESVSSSGGSSSNTETTTTTVTTYIPLSSVAYSEVSTSLIDSNSLVDQLLIFGAAHIIKVANQKYSLANLNFTVSKVHHLYVKTIGDYIDYKFDVELSNSQGYYIDAVFCVGYYNSTGKMEWISYKWNLNYFAPQSEQTETTTTTTETVVVTEVENAANVVEAPKVLPEVVEQPAPETQTVVVVEQVSQPAPEAEVVSEQPKPEADCETSSSTETVQVISSSNISPSVEAAQPAVDTEAASSSSQTESTTTNTTVTTSEAAGDVPTPQGYNAVSTSLIGSDALVDKLLSYGANQVIKVAASKNTITDLNFHVSKANSLYKQVIGNRWYYKFDVQLQNSEGVTIDATFVVRYCVDVQTIHWLSYNYEISIPVQAPSSSK